MKKTFKGLLSLTLVFLLVFSTGTPLAFAAAPAKVKSLKAYNIDDDEINLKWKKVSGAEGYVVYMYTSKGWKKQGSTKKTKFEVDDLSSAKSYKFKVRAYDVTKGKKTYGAYSSVLTTATTPDDVDDLKVVKKSETYVKLSWPKEKRVTKYQVYMYDSEAKKYVRKKSVKKPEVTIKKLEAGTTYKFKVRAYLKVDDKVYYGEFSDVLSVKTKGKAAGSTSSENKYIGTSKAGQVALDHANLSKSQVRDYECKLDRENGIRVYEVEFTYKNYEYEYEINAVTGKIISVEKERD